MAIDRPRLHCHSAFKHYQMYHRDCGCGYGNSVFNYTYNFEGGNICGGGFLGGLWGGIGYSLGNFFGRLFGNYFGSGFNFYSCYGGNYLPNGGSLSQFNMMSTSPFSLYGNSYLFNPANFWSVNSNNNDKGVNSPKKNKQKETDNESKETNDNKEAEPETLTDDDFNKLLENAKTPKELDKLLKENEDKLTGAQKTKIDDAIKKAKPEAEAKGKEEAAADAALNQNKFDVNTVTLNDVDKIIDNIDKINKDKAIELLGDRVDDVNETVAVPRNYAELLLAQKTGYTILFCKNKTKKTNKSKTIEGKIESISPLQNNMCTVTVTSNLLTASGHKNAKHQLVFNFTNGVTETVTLKKREDALIYDNNEIVMDKDITYKLDSNEAKYATRDNDKSAIFNPERTNQ